MLTDNTEISVLLALFGFSALWGIREVVEQERRVAKGWFPKRNKKYWFITNKEFPAVTKRSCREFLSAHIKIMIVLLLLPIRFPLRIPALIFAPHGFIGNAIRRFANYGICLAFGAHHSAVVIVSRWTALTATRWIWQTAMCCRLHLKPKHDCWLTDSGAKKDTYSFE